MKEQWRPVAGYEGLYEVSNLGNVRGLDRVDTSGRKRKGRTLNPARTVGYPVVTISCGGRELKEYVHSLVLTAFVGPRPAGMQCRHLDGTKTNNHLSNLSWGTRPQNRADQKAHGTFNPPPHPPGESHPSAKLTVNGVIAIRSSNDTHAALAREYKVDAALIARVRKRTSWKHVA